MTRRATAMFAIKGWDEKPYNEAAGLPKLTRASVTKTFKGDLEGESQLEYLMLYRADGTASFVGLERVLGRLGGRSGSFVLQRISPRSRIPWCQARAPGSWPASEARAAPPPDMRRRTR